MVVFISRAEVSALRSFCDRRFAVATTPASNPSVAASGATYKQSSLFLLQLSIYAPRGGIDPPRLSTLRARHFTPPRQRPTGL
jgi:hypothetical protein